MSLHFAKVTMTHTTIDASRLALSENGEKSSRFRNIHYKQQMATQVRLPKDSLALVSGQVHAT